jgi:thioredoxin-like negative regulator of GroEL
MLAEVPEAQARASLRRRVEADPTDLDARVALILRSIRPENDPAAGRPRVGLPSSREPGAVVELEEIVETNPGHLGGRAALVDLLLDLGRIDRARSVLDAWPRGDLEDPRRLRLEARLDLDHDARPDRASETLRGLVAASPHDWRLRARLARALEMARDTEAARLEAKSVDRLRERLNPDRLGRRLAEDFRDLDDPSAMLDLAELCASVGLSELAAAWRIEANAVGPAGRAD